MLIVNIRNFKVNKLNFSSYLEWMTVMPSKASLNLYLEEPLQKLVLIEQPAAMIPQMIMMRKRN